MIAGLYAASTSLDAIIHQQDAISGNLANVGVSGHKAETVVFRSFPEILFSNIAQSGEGDNTTNRTIGKVGTGVGVDWSYLNHQPGPIVQTGVPTDLSLDGDGYFVVETPRGERYTRNSQYKIKIDQDGRNGTLTTAEGYPLLGQQGPVRVPVDKNFQIDFKGNVLVDGNRINQLRLITVPEKNVLKPESGALFQVEDRWRNDIQPASEVVVQQGYLEKSNVNSVLEMVRMVESFRNYETSARVLTVLDQTLSKTVNELGRA